MTNETGTGPDQKPDDFQPGESQTPDNAQSAMLTRRTRQLQELKDDVQNILGSLGVADLSSLRDEVQTLRDQTKTQAARLIEADALSADLREQIKGLEGASKALKMSDHLAGLMRDADVLPSKEPLLRRIISDDWQFNDESSEVQHRDGMERGEYVAFMRALEPSWFRTKAKYGVGTSEGPTTFERNLGKVDLNNPRSIAQNFDRIANGEALLK